MKTTNFKRLANISPTELSRFLPELISVFVEETGIERGDEIYAPLITIADSEGLTKVDWTTISSSLLSRTKLSGDKIDTFLQHVRILADRIVLYGRIRRSLPGTELVNRGKYPLPRRYPEELQPTINEFHQLKYNLDDDLRSAQVATNQFQHLLIQGASIPTLHKHLQQARDAYNNYQRSSERLDELHGFIRWYLAQVGNTSSKNMSASAA